MSDHAPILAIDPGTTTLGTSILHLNVETGKITVKAAKTFNAAREFRPSGFWQHVHDPQVLRINYLSNRVQKLLWGSSPNVVACESPFSHQRPDAFAALVRIQMALYNAVRGFDASKSLLLVSPNEAKTSVGATVGKQATKDNVRESVLKLPLVWDPLVDPALVDEHSIDAIAVGVFTAKKILENPYAVI